MKTNHPAYEETFEKIAAKRDEAKPAKITLKLCDEKEPVF
jgi:hypothetical protein